MNFWQRIMSNPKKSAGIVLAFVVLMISYMAFAPEAEGAEWEVGPTYTSTFNGGFVITLTERFAGKYDIGMTLFSEQSWENVRVGNNGNFWAALVIPKPDKFWRWLPSEMAIGPAAWIKNQSPINGCTLGYMLNLKYRFGDNFSIGWRHWSNAGTCTPNRGQDLLAFGWRF